MILLYTKVWEHYSKLINDYFIDPFKKSIRKISENKYLDWSIIFLSLSGFRVKQLFSVK